MEEYKNTLKKWFKFDDFRKNQYEVVKALIEDYRDVCIIMCTGGGKSLCYQFPPIHTNTTCLVISPLISLMNDQKLKLEELNISSCCLNSTVYAKDKLKEEIRENKYRLVYTTPEYITVQEDFIRELYDTNVLSLIAIDEAHVVSTWAQDFRESYKKLNCLRQWIPDVPIVALTATATKKVQNDIVKHLELDNPLVIKTTFDRPNINIKVIPKGSDAIEDLLQVITKDEPTIVYCQTRANTDDLAYALTKKGIKSKSYHAGMKTSDRNKVHEDFASAKLNCVVATIAFGLGIDITIRKVIHYGMPKDMESYYQEIGRAGRDGKPSTCYLFYALSDTNNINYFLSQIKNVTYRNHMMQLSLIMKNYIFSSECRRKFILEYFGEEYDKTNCGNCDNCLVKKVVRTYDFAEDASKLFNVMNLTGNCYGSTILIAILRGANSNKIKPHFKKSPYYNTGSNHSEKWWKIFISMMLNEKYIAEKHFSGGRAFTLSITKKASEWLGLYKIKKGTQLILPVPETMNNLLPSSHAKQDDQVIADTIDSMIESVYKKEKTFEKTYEVFANNKNKTLKQIAIQLKLNARTVEDHIVKAYDHGKDVDLGRLGLTDDIYQMISKKVIQLKNPKKLSKIKNALPHHISYLHIKLSQIKMKKDDANKVIVVKPKKKLVNVINMDSIMENIIKKNYYIPNKKIDEEYFNLLSKI